MELGSVVVDKLKEVAKSTQLFADGLFRDSARRTPIEILKRLQRESFSDIMKLRDRQEIVEKLLSSFRTSERSPFKEAATHVKGKVDVVGAIFIMDDVDEQKYDAIERSGIRTGIDARLTFGTHVREKDELVAEFVASEKSRGDVLGGPLSLAKVFYSAHLCNWLSAFAIPIGARYRDIFFGPNPHQERGLTAFSEFGPPLMNQNNGSAIGITASNSKVIASLSQFVSGLGMQVNSAGVCTGIAHSLSTFGLVSFQPTQNTKLSLLGVHRQSRPSGQNVNLGTFAFPIGIFKHNQCPEMSADDEDSPTSWERQVSDGSIALIFDSKVDERTRIGGWLETKNSNPRDFQWGVTVRDCDTPEEDFGWGLTVGGLVQDTKNFEHFQVETFLNLKVGSKLKLQPAVLYVKDGATHFPAMMLRSSWHI